MQGDVDIDEVTDHSEDLRFHSEQEEKSAEGCKQKTDIISLTLKGPLWLLYRK